MAKLNLRAYGYEFSAADSAFFGKPDALLEALVDLVMDVTDESMTEVEIVEWDLVYVDDGLWDWWFAIEGYGTLPSKTKMRRALSMLVRDPGLTQFARSGGG